MATRKFYDLAEYKAKTDELETVLAKCSPLDLSDPKYQVSGQPTDLNQIVYISMLEMGLFSAFADFDCRLIKLLNYGRPAIALSYFNKHKYFVDKKPPINEVKAILTDHIDNLVEQHIEGDTSESNQLLKKQIKKYTALLKRADNHVYAYSNYSRNYVYAYVTYRYFAGQSPLTGLIDSANTHLIKHTTNRDGEVTIERTNVIFVDEDSLSRRISYDNKQVDKFLIGFTDVINCGKYDLFIK